ncbi:hypothetical protein MRX96_019668 [Rhipicephalus microplus]
MTTSEDRMREAAKVLRVLSMMSSTCKSGQCVPKASLCDCHPDWEDGSDERHTICALDKKCAEDERARTPAKSAFTSRSAATDASTAKTIESNERGY